MSLLGEKLHIQKEPEEPLIPVGFLAKLLDDDPTLPMPGAMLGLSEEEAAEVLRWATPSELEAERRAQPSIETVLEELKQDPSVALIVEASTRLEPVLEK